MKKASVKHEIKRSTEASPPRLNSVMLSGTVDRINSTIDSIEDVGESIVSTVYLDNGLEFHVPTRWVQELGLGAGDEIAVRGELVSFAIDTLSGTPHRVDFIRVRAPWETTPRLMMNLRILKRSLGKNVRPAQFPVCEDVELRGVEYRIEANWNPESEEFEDFHVFAGSSETDVTDLLEDLYVKKSTGSYTSVLDELYREVSGRRGE